MFNHQMVKLHFTIWWKVLVHVDLIAAAHLRKGVLGLSEPKSQQLSPHFPDICCSRKRGYDTWAYPNLFETCCCDQNEHELMFSLIRSNVCFIVVILHFTVPQLITPLVFCLKGDCFLQNQWDQSATWLCWTHSCTAMAKCSLRRCSFPHCWVTFCGLPASSLRWVSNSSTFFFFCFFPMPSYSDMCLPLSSELSPKCSRGEFGNMEKTSEYIINRTNTLMAHGTAVLWSAAAASVTEVNRTQWHIQIFNAPPCHWW